MRPAICILVFIVSLAILWWNAAPSVTFHDSGEFAMAAASAGVPHPPGSPTWTILASAFVKLGGFHDAARGTNLFSGLCAALTLALVCWLTQIWTIRLFPAAAKWLAGTAGIGSAAILLRSPAFLEQSFTTEQYTLLTALMAAVMTVATAIAFRKSGATGLCLLLGLLWGLAIGNHPSQISLGLLVALGVWAGSRSEDGKSWLRLGGASALGLALGLLVFLWAPIRSHANPLMDWGNIKTWDRFAWAMTRQQWSTRPFGDAPPGFVSDWIASYDALGQLGILGLILTGVGLIALVKKSKTYLGWIAAAVIPYAAGMLLGHMHQKNIDVAYIRAYGVMDWHLPIYLAGALAGGIGIAAIPSALHKRQWASSLMAVGILFGLMVASGFAIKQSSLRHFDAPNDFIAHILAPVPKDAVILVEQDNLAFMLSYRRYVLRQNPEQWVAFRAVPVSRFMAKARCLKMGWDQSQKAKYLTEAVMEPNGQPLRIPPLSNARARTGRVFSDYSTVFNKDADYLLPAGLLFEVVGRPTTNQEVLQAERQWRRKYPNLLKAPGPDAHRLEKHAWAVMYRHRGAFFAARGLWPEAADQYARSKEWIGNDGQIWYCLAHSLDQSGKVKQAVDAYIRAIELSPYLDEPRGNLAVLYAQAGHLQEAEQLLIEALRINPKSKSARANLAIVRSQLAKGS